MDKVRGSMEALSAMQLTMSLSQTMTLRWTDWMPKERILAKLQRHYDLTEEKAKEYYDRFAVEAQCSIPKE